MSSPAKTQLRVHDLIGPVPPGAVLAEDAREQPAVDACLARAPFVVVRRAAIDGTGIPVGVRGALREERYAARLVPATNAGILTPEMLRIGDREELLPALHALAEVERRWGSFDLPWGPAGSVGFALTSGMDCVHSRSDLDLIVRAPSLPSAAQAAEWLRVVSGLACRVDLHIETPAGGVSLLDLLAGHERILMRTLHGPRLIARPAQDPPAVTLTQTRPA